MEDFKQHLRVIHRIDNRLRIDIGWFETYPGSRQHILRRESPNYGYNDELMQIIMRADITDPLITRRFIDEQIRRGI